MIKIIRKETQNHAITHISFYSWSFKVLDKWTKKNYTLCVLSKNVIWDTQKAKNLKKTDASFRGLGRFFMVA
ncbi:hypothetical protein EC565_03740 [Helicobacter pylori]|nr:hypothetical protein EC565_03740 [Helicobacter pylori]